MRGPTAQPVLRSGARTSGCLRAEGRRRWDGARGEEEQANADPGDFPDAPHEAERQTGGCAQAEGDERGDGAALGDADLTRDEEGGEGDACPERLDDERR